MKYVSMKELRENFAAVKKGINQGESYILLYRSKPLMRLEPIESKKQEKDLEGQLRNDLKTIDKLSGDLHLGKGSTPEELRSSYDKEVYGKV